MPNTNLLVVDDNVDLCDVIVRVFQHLGYKATGVYAAEPALDTLSKQPFDLVITDMSMPGMDGLELIAKIRTRYQGLPVILITGNLEVDTHALIENTAAAAVLYKPFVIDDLVKMVVKVLAKSTN